MKLTILAATLVFVSTSLIPPACADDSRVIELNNQGVAALNRARFSTAIEFFKKAVEIDPTYKKARNNLVIAYTDFGLSIARANPKKSLKAFCNALMLDPSNSTTRQNIEGIIRMIGKDPKSFEHRVALGDQALQENDLKDAIIHYEAALLIKDDASVSEKLGLLKLQTGGMIPNLATRDDENEATKPIPDDLADEHSTLISFAMATEISAHEQLRKGVPASALREFHEAAYINQYLDRNQQLKANIEGIEDSIRKLGKDPKKFEDRIELAEQAKKNGDYSGAVIEYSAALLIKDDPAIHRKLAEAYLAKNEPDKAAIEEAAAGFLEVPIIQVQKDH